MVYDLLTGWTSPAQSPRAFFGHTGPPTSITLHWWGDPAQRPSFEGVCSYLCRPGAVTSAHFVAETGRVACLVSPDMAAWHAGSALGNGSSIGIEVNPRLADEDYATVAELVRDLRTTYGDLPLFPHRHWSSTACPGVLDVARVDREARALGAGAVATAPTPSTPKPAPAPQRVGPDHPDWSDMATRDEIKSAMLEVLGTPTPRKGPGQSGQTSMVAVTQWHDASQSWVAGEASRQVLDTPIQRAGDRTGLTSLRTTLSWLDHNLGLIHTKLDTIITLLRERKG